MRRASSSASWRTEALLMRVLIILCYDDYIRFYVKTGAFSAIQREHDCRFVISDRCKTGDQMKNVPGFAGTISIDSELERKHQLLFDVLTWRYRHRSRTFGYRFSRQYRTLPNDSVWHVLGNLRGLRSAAKLVALGNRVVGPMFVRRQLANLPFNPDLVRVLDEHRPDVVILPTACTEPIGNDLVRLANKTHAFRTLFVIDNWDNLSSKSVFWDRPDHLAVWGEQAREHAVKIHDVDPASVSLVGTPRFGAYYTVDKGATKRHYEFPYILFCGAALAFDELGALHRLDDELAAHPDVYGTTKIVYRPHPRRQKRLCPDLFQERDFRRVVLDEQLRDAYYRDDGESQPALDYYPSLLAEAELVVCPLTTMLVESLLCGTPVLAITYDDGIHYTSPHNAYKYYVHFEGIESIVGLHLNRDAATLGADMRALIAKPQRPSRDAIYNSLQYFLYRDARPYEQRLAGALATLQQRADQ
jgi:hypothetical protein